MLRATGSVRSGSKEGLQSSVEGAATANTVHG